MKYNMSHSMFVVLFLLLVCCISGYAQNKAQQGVDIDGDGQPPPPSFEAKMMPGHEQLQPLQQQIKKLREQTEPIQETEAAAISFRQFHGSHVVEFVNGELVAIAGMAHWFKDKSESVTDNNEYVEFLSQDMNSKGEWDKLHVKWFGPNTEQYIKNLNNHKPHGEPRAVVAIVESNNLQIQEDSQPESTPVGSGNSILRIVWMTTLKDGTKKYSLSYTSFNVAFPFTNGAAKVLRFLANESTPILTMKKGTFVFPVHFFTAENTEYRSTVMYYTPHNKQWNIGGLVDEGAYNPAIIEWKEGNLIMIAQHTSMCQRVYESTDLGKTWKESTSTLSCVWANSPEYLGSGNRNSFITATIGGKDVILFVHSEDSQAGIVRHLFVTDKTHIYHAGVIHKDNNGNPCTLVFKYKKLYCRHDENVLSVDLTTKMEEIKKVLTKWTEQDKTLSGKDCTSSVQCKYPVPTNGLVGYLSGKSDERGKWNDEYNCVNAVVSGTPKKVPNGFTFNGVGSGAMWPVSTNGPTRPYHFANYAFTFAATVTIHTVPEKESGPLLGVRLKNTDNEIFLGVSYNNDKTWSTTSKGNEGKAKIPNWELGKEYSVILTFENGKGSVYINGTRLNMGTDLKIAEGREISHFYFGAYSEDEAQSGESEEGKTNVHITVKDVLLYNRGLLRTEIDALVKNKANKDSKQAKVTSSATASPQSSNSSTATAPTTIDGTTSGPQSTKITKNTNSGGEVNSQITVQLANTHQNTIDGTVRVYGYVLPILLLGLWVLATILP